MNRHYGDSELSDEDLIELMKTNEREAVKRIYGKYWKALLKYAFRLIQNKAEAKDIVQEVFVRMVIKEQFKLVEKNLHGYLFTAVRYECIRFLQTHIPAVDLDEEHDLYLASTHKEHAAHPIVLKELEYRYEKYLLDLSPRVKEIFELSRKEGLNPRQISLHLGLSNQTVRNQLAQAIRILRQKLDSSL